MWKLLLLLLLVCLITFDVKHTPVPNKVILITLDGVRWQEMFDGKSPSGAQVDSRKLLPNIYHWFVDHGAAFGKESEVRVGGPAHVSLPGYLEIMRGYPSLDCVDNECPRNRKPTLTNIFGKNGAVFASWDLINHVVDDSSLVNAGRNYRNDKWFQTGLADNKSYPVAWGDEEYRPDVYTVAAALEYQKRYDPDFLWISFGDTDEYAHNDDYAGYLGVLHWADDLIGQLMKDLPWNTTVILCPDHGRSEDWTSHHWDPASGRVWVLMAGNKVPALGFVKLEETAHLYNVYYTILGIKDSSEHSLLSLKR